MIAYLMRGTESEGDKPIAVVSLKKLCQSATEKSKRDYSMKARNRMELGQYIVADPEICHGQMTFKGTRIMVRSVLEMLAKGKDWDWISQEYEGRVNREAIAEAVSLANEALLEKTGEQRRAA